MTLRQLLKTGFLHATKFIVFNYNTAYGEVLDLSKLALRDDLLDLFVVSIDLDTKSIGVK